MTNKTVTMPLELAPCPFCGCESTLLTGREDHRIAGKHSKSCPFIDVDVVVDSREAWNTRVVPAVERQEPVAWELEVEGYKTVLIDNYQRALSEQEHFQGRGRTSAIHGLFRSPPAPVAVVQERWEFEKWIVRDWPTAPIRYVRDALPENDPLHGTYCDEYLQRAWVGWQARACLDKVKETNL